MFSEKHVYLMLHAPDVQQWAPDVKKRQFGLQAQTLFLRAGTS